MYAAEMNGKIIKKFPAKSLEAAYRQYNSYCKKKLAAPELIPDSCSVGFYSWAAANVQIKLKRLEGI